MPTARSSSAASRATSSMRSSSSGAEAARLDDEFLQAVEAGRMVARPEIGEEACDALREIGRGQRKTIDPRHRALLVQEVDAVQREHGLAEAGDGAEGATRQVGDVAAIEALACIGEREPGLPFEALAQRLGERCRIRRRATLPGCKRAGWIVQEAG